MNPHRRAARLRHPQLNLAPGERIARFLIENQIVRHEMNGILHALGLGLIGLEQSLGIRLKVDAHFALGCDVARLRVVAEVVAVDLVVAAGVAAIQRDGDVVQLSPPPVLNCTALLACTVNSVRPCSDFETLNPSAVCWMFRFIFAGICLKTSRACLRR